MANKFKRLEFLKQLYKQSVEPIVPDPFCLTCKGTGKETEISPHNGDPYESNCSDCIDKQSKSLNEAKERLSQFMLKEAREIILSLVEASQNAD